MLVWGLLGQLVVGSNPELSEVDLGIGSLFPFAKSVKTANKKSGSVWRGVGRMTLGHKV